MVEGESVDMLNSNCQKLFDKLPQQRLLQKIKVQCVGGIILMWIEGWQISGNSRH